jgi:hypothetical protein
MADENPQLDAYLTNFGKRVTLRVSVKDGAPIDLVGAKNDKGRLVVAGIGGVPNFASLDAAKPHITARLKANQGLEVTALELVESER